MAVNHPSRRLQLNSTICLIGYKSQSTYMLTIATIIYCWSERNSWTLCMFTYCLACAPAVLEMQHLHHSFHFYSTSEYVHVVGVFLKLPRQQSLAAVFEVKASLILYVLQCITLRFTELVTRLCTLWLADQAGHILWVPGKIILLLQKYTHMFPFWVGDEGICNSYITGVRDV